LANAKKLETLSQIGYLSNLAAQNFLEVQKLGEGFTLALKGSFEYWLKQKPLSAETLELLLKLKNLPPYRQLLVTANLDGFPELVATLERVHLKAFRQGLQIEVVTRGFILVDDAGNIANWEILPSIQAVEDFLDSAEDLPF